MLASSASTNSVTTDPIIDSKGLTKIYGNFSALSDCSISVERGEVFGLLGPNGAGKSTWIRLLLGFLKPTSGSASICGLDCHSQTHEVHRHVSYMPGDARLFRMMKGRRVLKLFSELRERDSALQARCFQRGLQLAEKLELDLTRWVGLMSTGMRQKLALVCCFMAESPVLILDEPTANLDPTVRSRILDLVLEARKRGQTILFSSHVLSEIEDVCDRVAILRRGELVHLAPMSEIRLKHRIRARLQGDLPLVPNELQRIVVVERNGDHLQIDTPGELPAVLRWLANLNLTGMHVQPVGLRAVYDQFHNGGVACFSDESEQNK